MAAGGISTQRWHAGRWLRSEGLFSAALRVSWHGAPAIFDGREAVDTKKVARLCVALARSNALFTAWQALAIALVEPELRDALAGTEEIPKLDVVLGHAPGLATWFELPVRSSAATELRVVLDDTIVFPAVQPDALSQWFDKPVARLASVASEHLALQLEARGMRALPFVLGIPGSPAFSELAGHTSARLRHLWASLAKFPMRESPPSLVDRWIADLYAEARLVGRARSDVIVRGRASVSSERPAESARASLDSDMPPTIPRATIEASVETEASLRDTVRPGRPNLTAVAQERDEGLDSIAERAIDEQWITLADGQATPDDSPPIETSGPVKESALLSAEEAPRARERRPTTHLGLAVFVGALAGSAVVAVLTALEGRDGASAPIAPSTEVEPGASAAAPPRASPAIERETPISETSDAAL
jgi:hypothetical protein